MMQTTDRPTQISAILKNISLKYPDDIGASLEAYIADLEVKQQVVAALNELQEPTWDPENPPVWSHERAIQRQRHIRERSVRRWRQENNYQ